MKDAVAGSSRPYKNQCHSASEQAAVKEPLLQVASWHVYLAKEEHKHGRKISAHARDRVVFKERPLTPSDSKLHARVECSEGLRIKIYSHL